MARPSVLPRLAAICAAAPLLAMVLAAAAPVTDAPESLTIIDRVGPSEVEENIAVYIDQQMIGTFRLTRDHPFDTLQASVPAAPSHVYAMCGTVRTREPDGTIKDHQVDTSGTIFDVGGRTYEAVTGNYDVFFLNDETLGTRGQIAAKIIQGKTCEQVTS
jgi:hypothetical protein